MIHWMETHQRAAFIGIGLVIIAIMLLLPKSPPSPMGVDTTPKKEWHVGFKIGPLVFYSTEAKK